MKPHRPRHSTVVAYLALFVALGGTGYAATRLPANSVGTGQIRNHSVHRIDLARNARPRHGRRGHVGATGPAGPQGPQGAQGPTGAPGTVNWSASYFTAEGIDLTTANPSGHVTANCRPGDHAINGGFSGAGEIVTTSSVTDGFKGWIVFGHLDPSVSGGVMQAWVECAP